MSSTEDKIKVMQAYVDGEEIQIKSSDGWIDVQNDVSATPSWNWRWREWRIKPKQREWVIVFRPPHPEVYDVDRIIVPEDSAEYVKVREVLE